MKQKKIRKLAPSQRAEVTRMKKVEEILNEIIEKSGVDEASFLWFDEMVDGLIGNEKWFKWKGWSYEKVREEFTKYFSKYSEASAYFYNAEDYAASFFIAYRNILDYEESGLTHDECEEFLSQMHKDFNDFLDCVNEDKIDECGLAMFKGHIIDRLLWCDTVRRMEAEIKTAEIICDKLEKKEEELTRRQNTII